MLHKWYVPLLSIVVIMFSEGCSSISHSRSIEEMEKEIQLLEVENQKKAQIQRLRDQRKALDAGTDQVPAQKTIEELTKDLSEAKKRKALEEELAK